MELGEVLKRLRRERGMTQADIAQVLHVNRSTYTKYETGVNMPSVEQIKALSIIFGVSSDEILKSEPNDNHKEIPSQVIKSKPAVRSDEEKLLGVYNSLDDQSKTQLMSVAYLLAANTLAQQGVNVNQFVEQQLHKIHNKGGEEDEG